MKPLQMVPSFFTAHVWHWGDVHIESFGVQRASLISPLRGALQLGLMSTLCTDTPVVAPNLMGFVWCAAVRHTRNGVFLGEEERIDIYEALRTVTQYTTWQYREGDREGALEAGELADFAVLGQSPLEIPVEEMRSTQVLETWKGGACIYKRQMQESQNI